ncbi:cytochrome c oxidase subunit II [Ramlibacter sp. 2FC]|uniref:cytochrome c oxidase subunit II n=1 Tax=Ramlibacter sp. 2FC TaxID=2502188 RepID=UPI0010FA363F|nr:cytochrome c oxidase subunit II [Ramlibacter sp. 2FC]
MAIAIALVVIVAASVLFHFVNPWWAPPLASNWRQMDDTMTITLVMTGLFFVGVNLFVVYTLLRFRHRAGQRAAYQPENRRLERWLTGLTTLGIMALLAPGLFVYASYVHAPGDALVLEVLGQQWQWRYRLPGADGKLGGTDVRFVNAGNPFGIDPADPAGQDDRLVAGGDLHLPLNQPVKLLLRSHDVLHDFYAPPMRARMNIVPGQVGSFWFTPTVAGRFEAMCAQLCGVGHPNMRAVMVVEPPAAFQAWVAGLPTFAASLSGAGRAAAPAPAAGTDLRVAQGQALAESRGCVACHSVDGSARVGPSWKGLYGTARPLADGSQAQADEAYLKRAIREPAAQLVKGFPPVMPATPVSDEELDALLAYLRSLGGAAPAAPEQKAQR